MRSIFKDWFLDFLNFFLLYMYDLHFIFQDYIVPATCNEPEFRQMWAVFEWENKVAVNTTLTDLHDYLEHLLKVRILYTV